MPPKEGPSDETPLLNAQGFAPFCNRLGIIITPNKPGSKEGPKAQRPSIYQDLRYKLLEYRIYYVALLSIAIVGVVSQIALGIIISVLSGIDVQRFKVAIIVLGAVNSFIGGVSAWLQYQGQPTRCGQFTSALSAVRLEILESHGDLRDSGTEEDGEAEGRRIKSLYKQALLDGLANQPDVWSRGNILPGDLRGGTGEMSTRQIRELDTQLDNLGEQKDKNARRNASKSARPEAGQDISEDLEQPDGIESPGATASGSTMATTNMEQPAESSTSKGKGKE